jgi:hypothetical protein
MKQPTTMQEVASAVDAMNDINGGIWTLNIYGPLEMVAAVIMGDEGARIDCKAASEAIGKIMDGNGLGCALCRAGPFGKGNLPGKMAIMRGTEDAIVSAFHAGKIKDGLGIMCYPICDACDGPDLSQRVVAMMRKVGGFPDMQVVNLSEPGNA